MIRKIVALSTLLILSSLVLSACGAGVGLEGSDVTFDVSVIEIKGSTDGIDAPDVDPASLSAGYGFKEPGVYDGDNPDKWQVATYLFSPSALTAVKGDNITLRMFVINGDTHVTWLEAPDGSVVEEWTMNRGREYNISFTADQAGYYTMHCNNHAPTMSANILVLP